MYNIYRSVLWINLTFFVFVSFAFLVEGLWLLLEVGDMESIIKIFTGLLASFIFHNVLKMYIEVKYKIKLSFIGIEND